MLENQFSQFGEIRLRFPIVYKVLSLFLYLLAVYVCTSVCERNHGAAAGGAPAITPTFRHRCSFLWRSYTTWLPTPAKLPELQLKFDDQSSSFQNFLRPIRLDPSRWVAPSAINHGLSTLNYAPWSLHCVLSIILSLKLNDNVQFYG